MNLRRALSFAVALVAMVPALAPGAPNPKLDQTLQVAAAAGCTGTQSVIIRARPGTREALRTALASHGDRITSEFPALDAITADVHCDDLAALAKFDSTASISANHAVRAHQLETGSIDYALTESTTIDGATPETLLQETTIETTSLSMTTASSWEAWWNRLWEGLTVYQLQTNLFSTLAVRQSSTSFDGLHAPSVGVAVIDSGIAPGIDFGSRLTGFFDFTQGDIRSVAASDEYGHGTHVAGLIASSFVGVSPTARLVGLKVLDEQGRGTADTVIRAIEFAIASKDVLNIQVLNLSLGHPIYESASTDPLVQAVEHAARAGLVVVVSAGNFGRNRTTGVTGYGGVNSPGNAPSGISVGSVRTFDTVSRDDDRIAGHSSRGPSWIDGYTKPDLSAPGDNLLSVAAVGSTLRRAQELRGNVGNYMRLSGTSMAAAVATGMVAQVLKNNRGLTPNALKMVLQYSSLPVKNEDGTYANVLTQGAGAINGGAVALASAINASAPMGSNWLVASVTPSTTIGGQSYVWGQRMVWGNHIARGADVTTEQRPAWALDIIWGDGLEDDDNIVWGNYDDDDNIVWGNALDLDDNIVWGNNIVWTNSQEDDDNVVWRNLDDDNIVWGNSVLLGAVVETAPNKGLAVAGAKASAKAKGVR